MKNFDYYEMAQVVEFWKNTLRLNIPLWKGGLPERDSVDEVDNILEYEWEKKPYFAFKKWRKLKNYWEQTNKVIYVDKKWNNFLTVRSQVFVIRKEVKEEIEKIFWKEINEYLEFLDVNLLDVETKEEINDIWKWYIMNILKVVEWAGEKKYRHEWKLYWEVLYKEKVLDEKWSTKFPIFRLKESITFPFISKEFKEKIIDKFDDEDNARVYSYKWIHYKEDLVWN